MKDALSARYYQNLRPEDLHTDTVQDSEGNHYAITLTIHDWKNIDWINNHAIHLTEAILVDDALFELKVNPGYTLSDAVEAGIYHFAKAFQDAKKERLSKQSKQTPRKETTGNA